MPWQIVEVADAEGLRWLGEQFRTAARRGPRLLHATRLLLDPDEGALAHTERDWQEFIPDNNPFTFAAFHRPVSGIQQSCFYGDKGHLDSFVPLALLAGGKLPGNFLHMRGRATEVPARAHAWVLAVYHIAVRTGGQIPLRYSEPTTESSVAGSVTNWPWTLAAELDRDLEADRADLMRWHADPSRKRRKKTRYVYASLRQDVFTASALAIDYILANEHTLYTPYEALAVGEKPDGPGVQLPAVRPPEMPIRDVARYPNIERDEWMHDLALHARTYKEILAELKSIVSVRKWRPLGSERAVREAVNRFRQQHLKLPSLKRRGN